MKTTLIGLSNNIALNIEKIKVWSSSFKKYCPDGKIVLLAANTTEEDIIACNSLDIVYKQVRVEDTWYINHKRLSLIKDFLETEEDGLFLVTDVFDVIFQGNPFSKLDYNRYDVFISEEGVTVNQEPWNSDNINKLFPEYYEMSKSQEVVNSGVIAGKRQALIDLYSSMYNLCESSTKHHNIQDQAALIVKVAKKEIKNLKIFNLDDGWAMHCAVAGPTAFFESWGFKNSIKYGIPKMYSNVVQTACGNTYDIVHQFNRVPEWHEVLVKQYK